LPFPDVYRNFDAAYTVWAGGVLVCRGDGEFVEYAAPFKVTKKQNGGVSVRNAAGDTLVSGGAAQVPFDWNGTSFEPGELVPCPGASKELYPHCLACRMSAILKVMMADPRLFRLGYYQIATGSTRNYDTILGTLELIEDQAGKVNGIPFKLRMVKEPTTYRDNGKRKKTEKWFLQLEPDPTFTRKLYSRTASNILALPPGDDGGDVSDEVHEGQFVEAEDPAPPPFAEAGGPAEEPEPTQDKLVKVATEELDAVLVGDVPAEVREAMDYVTDSGKRLGDLGAKELGSMVDQINALNEPTQKMIKLRGHAETIIEWRRQQSEEIPL